MINKFLDFLFPLKCVGCSSCEYSPQNGLCNKCSEKIESSERISEDIFSAAAYGDQTLKQVIWFLKYRGVKRVSVPLSNLIFERLPNDILQLFGRETSKWVIIPVPLSKERLRERKFNQAELIAKHLVGKLNLVFDSSGKNTKFQFATNILYKIKHTSSQVSIKDRRERLNNLKNSFAVKNKFLVKGENIILIDDVCTTGATIREVKKTLRKSGAKKIVALTVAHG